MITGIFGADFPPSNRCRWRNRPAESFRPIRKVEKSLSARATASLARSFRKRTNGGRHRQDRRVPKADRELEFGSGPRPMKLRKTCGSGVPDTVQKYADAARVRRGPLTTGAGP